MREGAVRPHRAHSSLHAGHMHRVAQDGRPGATFGGSGASSRSQRENYSGGARATARDLAGSRAMGRPARGAAMEREVHSPAP